MGRCDYRLETRACWIKGLASSRFNGSSCLSACVPALQVVALAPIQAEVLPRLATFLCPKTLVLPRLDITVEDPPIAVRAWCPSPQEI